MKKKFLTKHAKDYEFRSNNSVKDIVDVLRYQSNKNEPNEDEVEIFLKSKFSRLSKKTGKNYQCAAIPLLKIEDYLNSIITQSSEAGNKEINRHHVVLGAKHYVGIDITYDPQKKQFDLIFFDPLGEESGYYNYFLQNIHDAFKNIDISFRIIACPSNIQTAGTSCWIFAILGLAEFAKADNVFDSMKNNCEIKKIQNSTSSFDVTTLAPKFLPEKLIDMAQSYSRMNEFLAGKYNLKERITKLNTHKKKYEIEGKNQLIEKKRSKWATQLEEIDQPESKNELTKDPTATNENNVENDNEEKLTTFNIKK